MAWVAARQMCSGVRKSGSPRLKSKTWTPSARNCRALAPAASVADGCTAAAILDIGIVMARHLGVAISRDEASLVLVGERESSMITGSVSKLLIAKAKKAGHG